MKIGIHSTAGSYSDGWINYCKRQGYEYKIVNAYSSGIVNELADCSIFLWHHHQANPKDVLMARQLLYSLEESGKIVYPDWRTGWHFDDKVGQKYLLESFGLPLIPSYVFYSRKDALEWASTADYPAVFKLRGGAGSYNVKLIRNRKHAQRLINLSFGRGFRQYSPLTDVKEQYLKFKKGDGGIYDIFKGLSHFFLPYRIEKAKGRERGYFYTQEFVAGCDHDIRVQMVGNRGYAMKRYVRKNDFRASGGGNIDYDGSKVPLSAIELSRSVADILGMQSLAIDLLPYNDGYLIAEISYAFGIDEGELDYGYFDSDLNWHTGTIDPFGWLIEDMIQKDYLKSIEK